VLDFDEISVASLSTTAGTRLANQEERAALLDALQTLPLDQQLLLEMFYWQELAREQIAEIYAVPAATIGTRLFRARKALQDHLDCLPLAASRRSQDFDTWARSLRPQIRDR
jgi:RNA polymerase sigma factor (sigma-70 family)